MVSEFKNRIWVGNPRQRARAFCPNPRPRQILSTAVSIESFRDPTLSARNDFLDVIFTCLSAWQQGKKKLFGEREEKESGEGSEEHKEMYSHAISAAAAA